MVTDIVAKGEYMAVTQASGGTGNLTEVELRSYRVLNDGTVAKAMCNPDGTNLNSILASTVTSSSANALTVGPNGTTNPTFNVDASTASAATGLNVKGAAAASGLAVSVLSSGTNENLTVDAKGSGTITLGGTSTGNIVLNRNVTFGGTRSGGTAAIISGSGATVTLTAAQSGSLILMDRAAGIVFTLPAPAVGLQFSFYVPVSVTSNNYKVITDAGTTLLVGSLVNVKTDLTTLFSIGNGSTHISVLMNGTTTGGLIGTYLRFTCVSSTLWSVDGSNLASGTIATPFSAT
jgi:hypothetical protein